MIEPGSKQPLVIKPKINEAKKRRKIRAQVAIPLTPAIAAIAEAAARASEPPKILVLTAEEAKAQIVRETGVTIEPIEFATDRDIWEQQPEEPQGTWETFCTYRDTPVSIRSFHHAFRQSRPELEYHHTRVWQLRAAEWRWRERATAHDLYMDRKHLALLEADRLAAIKEAAHVGKILRCKALEAAGALQATVYEEVIDIGTGEKHWQLRAALSVNEIVKLAQIGITLEREALGLDIHRGGTQVNVAIGMQTFNADSDQELRSRAVEILKVRELQTQIVEGEVIGSEAQPTTPTTTN